MQSIKDKKRKKRVYAKPKLRIIELAAEEVLAVGCKMIGGAPAAGGNPNCGISNNCVTDGS